MMMTNSWPSATVRTDSRIEQITSWVVLHRLVALGLAVLAVGVDGTVLSVALPTLSKALKTTESNLQWFSSGYFLVLAAAILSLMLLKSPGFRPSPISDQRIMSIGNCKLKS